MKNPCNRVTGGVSHNLCIGTDCCQDEGKIPHKGWREQDPQRASRATCASWIRIQQCWNTSGLSVTRIAHLDRSHLLQRHQRRKVFIRHYRKLAMLASCTHQKCSQKPQCLEVQLSIMAGGNKGSVKTQAPGKMVKTRNFSSSRAGWIQWQNSLGSRQTREKSHCMWPSCDLFGVLEIL